MLGQGKAQQLQMVWAIPFLIGFLSAFAAAVVANTLAMQGYILPPSGYIRIHPPLGNMSGNHWGSIDVTPDLAAVEGVIIESVGYKEYVIGHYQKWFDSTKDPLKIKAKYYRLKVIERRNGETDITYVDVPPVYYTDQFGELQKFKLSTGHDQIPPPQYALESGKVFKFTAVSDGDEAMDSPVVIKWKYVNSFKIK